ncbi:hypothetical protein KI387_021214, partial [Taxus chinensis]
SLLNNLQLETADEGYSQPVLHDVVVHKTLAFQERGNHWTPLKPILRALLWHLLGQLNPSYGQQEFPWLSPTQIVIAQLELWNERKSGKYEKKVYVLHKHMDEKVAALHLPKLGAKLTKLSADQTAYINVLVEGP